MHRLGPTDTLTAIRIASKSPAESKAVILQHQTAAVSADRAFSRKGAVDADDSSWTRVEDGIVDIYHDFLSGGWE